MSNSWWSHEPLHVRPPCPLPTPRVYSNFCPSSWWCHSTISSSVIPFSSCAQSFPASGSFQMSQLFTSGGQRIGVSASTSVLPMNTQDWSPLVWTCWISLHSKGLSRVFSNTAVPKHQFFGVIRICIYIYICVCVCVCVCVWFLHDLLYHFINNKRQIFCKWWIFHFVVQIIISNVKTSFPHIYP